MARFQLKDDSTGMTVEVESQKDLSEEDVRATLATARQKAQSSVEDGTYKFDPDSFQELPKEQAMQKLRKFSGYALGVKPEEVDINSGMGLWERTKLDMLPDEPSKMEYLEKKYGDENVSMLNVGGKPKMFYRDPKTKKMTMVDEMGASLADFTADIAGEAVTTAGAVGGAIGGAAVGGPAGAVAGAAGGGFLTGLAQDVIAESVTGQDIELGEKVKRRGIEAAIGVPIDIATMKLGGIVARRFGPDAGAKMLKTLEGASERTGIELTAAQKIGKSATERLQEISGVRPSSKGARKLARQRDEIFAKYRTSLEGGEVDPTESFGQFVDDVIEGNRNLVDEVAKTNKKAAQELEQVLQRDIDEVAAPMANFHALGQSLREVFLDPAEQQISRTSKELFTALREAGEGVEIPRETVFKAIRQAVKDMEPLDSAASRRVAKDIEKLAKGAPGTKTGILDQYGREIEIPGKPGQKNMTFSELKDRMDQINDVISRNKEAGFGTGERVAGRVFESLQGIRTQALERNPQLRSLFDETMDYYKRNVLGTKRGAFGSAVKEILADEQLTPRAAVEKILSDPQHIKETARLVRVGGGDDSALMNTLREAYASRKLGIFEGANAENLKNFRLTGEQRDIVETLYGRRYLRNLEMVQNRLKQGGNIKLATVREDELQEALSAFATDDVKRIGSQIAKRMQKETELRQIANNKILKAVSEGRLSELNTQDISKAFLNQDPKSVREAFSKVPNAAKPAIKQETAAELFNKFRGSGSQLGSNELDILWNPEQMARSLMRDKKLWRNAEEVLGKGFVQSLRDANEILSAAAVKSGREAQDIQPRFLLPGPVVYFVGDLFQGISNRFLGWAYGSDALIPLLKVMSKKVSPEVAEQNFNKVVLPLLFSEKGMVALARESSNDPRVEVSVNDALKGLGEQPPEQDREQE